MSMFAVEAPKCAFDLCQSSVERAGAQCGFHASCVVAQDPHPVDANGRTRELIQLRVGSRLPPDDGELPQAAPR